MKNILILFFIGGFSTLSYAQLKVSNTGNLTIGVDSINSHNIHGFTSFNDGIKVYTPLDGFIPTGIKVYSHLYNYTTYSAASIAAYTAKTNGVTYGIAGLHVPKANHYQPYAVGVYGSCSPTYAVTYPGIYAGYFYGDVRVTGTLYGTLLTPSTSTSSNDDIVQVFYLDRQSDNEEMFSEKLQQIPLLQYYRSPDANKMSKEDIQMYKEIVREHLDDNRENDSEDRKNDIENIDSEIPTEKQQTLLSEIKYGLDVDQMKKTFPELVYEDKHGNVSINYIEMIPILVHAINELQAEIKQIKNNSTESDVKHLALATSINTEDEVILSIAQNAPNPFSESTSIEVAIPNDIKTASIIIFDLSGKQVKKIDINERGVSRITVLGSGLSEGMYIYSLIADGKVAGTRKMILTK